MVEELATLVCLVKKNTVPNERVLTSNDLLEEVGIDSLEMIELLLAIENRFGIRIDFENLELEHLSSIDRLASFVKTQQDAVIKISSGSDGDPK